MSGTPSRFYGTSKRKTASGRLIAAAKDRNQLTPVISTNARPVISTPVTSTPTNATTPPHFQPGDTLQDRSDLYSEGGNISNSESEDGLGDFSLSQPLTGSSQFNASRESAPEHHVAVNSQSSLSNNLPQLLQNQQAMLLRMIQQQDEIKELQAQFGKRLEEVENTVSTLSVPPQTTINSGQHRKRLPRDLMVTTIRD